jgi:hypothetical protein
MGCFPCQTPFQSPEMRPICLGRQCLRRLRIYVVYEINPRSEIAEEEMVLSLTFEDPKEGQIEQPEIWHCVEITYSPAAATHVMTVMCFRFRLIP